jgi:protoporphyrinogen oxidase
MKKNLSPVAVIGAGPAGLTAAYELVRQGVEVHVYEATGIAGGMCRTITLWGCRVDIGPHRFFSTDPRVNRFWSGIVGNDARKVARLTRIYYKRRFFEYPLRPFNAFRNLGAVETARCLTSYGRQVVAPKKVGEDFESWVIARFGKRLYEIFFKTYSEKLWGIPCSELDADFAAQRIRKLSMFEVVKNAFFGGNRHKTLIDEFMYPIGGTGMVYERMRAFIDGNGGTVRFHQKVRRVITEGDRVTGLELENGETRAYDSVISTMPLTHLLRTLDGTPAPVREAAERLRFRNTIIVYLHVQGTGIFPDNWIYVHANDLQVGRITNFRNWVPELYGDSPNTILALEFWCQATDPRWSETDESLISLATRELLATGLVDARKVLDGFVQRVPNCYPIYSRGYKNDLQPVQDWLDNFSGLHVIGRYGAFKYNNQDHSILMGLLLSEKILQGADHNLWEVNSDYEVYQEEIVPE